MIHPDDIAAGVDVTIARYVASHTRRFVGRIPARIVSVDRKPRAPCISCRVRDERTGRVSTWTNYECGIVRGMRIVDDTGNDFYALPRDGTQRRHLAILRAPFDPPTGWGDFVRLRTYDVPGDWFFSRSWPAPWQLQLGHVNLDRPRAFSRGEYDPNRINQGALTLTHVAWRECWRNAGYPGVDPFHVVLDDNNTSATFRHLAIRDARAFEEQVKPTGTWLAFHRVIVRALEACSVRQLVGPPRDARHPAGHQAGAAR